MEYHRPLAPFVFILGTSLTLNSPIEVVPAGCTTLYYVPIFNYFFSLSSYLTDNAVNARPFLRPHVVPHRGNGIMVKMTTALLLKSLIIGWDRNSVARPTFRLPIFIILSAVFLIIILKPLPHFQVRTCIF
jgi:hypothetical protein